MIKMVIVFENREEYRVMNSVWAACLVGCAVVEQNAAVKTVFVIDAETGEVYRQIVRG